MTHVLGGWGSIRFRGLRLSSYPTSSTTSHWLPLPPISLKLSIYAFGIGPQIYPNSPELFFLTGPSGIGPAGHCCRVPSPRGLFESTSYYTYSFSFETEYIGSDSSSCPMPIAPMAWGPLSYLYSSRLAIINFSLLSMTRCGIHVVANRFPPDYYHWHSIQESGPADGWVNEDGGWEFCQYVIFHRTAHSWCALSIADVFPLLANLALHDGYEKLFTESLIWDLRAPEH